MQGTVILHLYNESHGVIYEAPAISVSVPAVDWTVDWRGFLPKLSLALFLAGVALILIYSVPAAVVKTQDWAAKSASRIIGETITQNPAGEVRPVPKEPYQPPFDPALPLENKIMIPAIGVNSALQEASMDTYEEALKKGVWRVPDFGTPADRSRPTILAAHRFGYLAWSNIFRRTNSFFNLPKLAAGERIEIDWKQRKYVYEVYKVETGEKISDYSADLILYTCELLNSPIRIFRYARLLEN